jgi:hypothetical protein
MARKEYLITHTPTTVTCREIIIIIRERQRQRQTEMKKRERERESARVELKEIRGKK